MVTSRYNTCLLRAATPLPAAFFHLHTFSLFVFLHFHFAFVSLLSYPYRYFLNFSSKACCCCCCYQPTLITVQRTPHVQQRRQTHCHAPCPSNRNTHFILYGPVESCITRRTPAAFSLVTHNCSHFYQTSRHFQALPHTKGCHSKTSNLDEPIIPTGQGRQGPISCSIGFRSLVWK